MKAERIFWIVLLLAVSSLAIAHNQRYMGKAFTFRAPDQSHVVDVMLEGQINELIVSLDTVEIGTRTNFCTPLN